MLESLLIFIDDDFDDPIYASPAPDELDEDLWHAICERLTDVLDGEDKSDGSAVVDNVRYNWRTYVKTGLSFVCATSHDFKSSKIDRYLQAVIRQYMEDVDDIRHPQRDGVEDIVLGVVPPWEEEED